MSSKPRLTYLQWDHRDLPEFAQLHMRLHAKCLSQFFDLTVVAGDCDYEQVCDRYAPDAVLFESGVNYRGARHPTIRNTGAHPSVPKIGLHNGDPWCEARTGFLSDMDEWGIETYFTISTTMAEHTPAVADRTFVWPNFIDPAVYHDYGEAKRIPVLITGKVSPLYPWRQRVHAVLKKHLPTMTCPHLGYAGEHASRMLFGEQYARTINASIFVPACGAVARDVLRKHFEVPACSSCLVTERSPALEACGFIDMTNCVFADSHDVLDKLDHLLRHPAELERITLAGYELVHERHTLAQRDQIRQWLDMRATLGPDEHLVQDNPFAPLRRVSRQPQPAPAIHLRGDGPHLQAMSQGDAELAAGHYDRAVEHYRRAACCIPWMPEPAFKLALCDLHLGRPDRAEPALVRLADLTLRTYGARDPDPVEWAYATIATLCTGDLAGAAARAARFAALRHPELDRTRMVIDVLLGVTSDADGVAAPAAGSRRSIHSLPGRSWHEWVTTLCEMLLAAGQRRHAATLHDALAVRGGGSRPPGGASPASRVSELPSASGTTRHKLTRTRPSTWARTVVVRRAPWLARLLRTTVRTMLPHLHRFEVRFGYFLPYPYSAAKGDEFNLALGELVAEHDVHTAALIGASAGTPTTEAVLHASRQRGTPPVWHFVNAPTRGFRRLSRRYRGAAFARFHAIRSATDGGDGAQPATSPLARDAERLDLLLLASCDALASVDVAHACHSRLVALHQLRHPAVFSTYQAMLAKADYDLLAVEPLRNGGYAIFGQRPAIAAP